LPVKRKFVVLQRFQIDLGRIPGFKQPASAPIAASMHPGNRIAVALDANASVAAAMNTDTTGLGQRREVGLTGDTGTRHGQKGAILFLRAPSPNDASARIVRAFFAFFPAPVDTRSTDCIAPLAEYADTSHIRKVRDISGSCDPHHTSPVGRTTRIVWILSSPLPDHAETGVW